jgi:hypothetical protein
MLLIILLIEKMLFLIEKMQVLIFKIAIVYNLIQFTNSITYIINNTNISKYIQYI